MRKLFVFVLFALIIGCSKSNEKFILDKITVFKSNKFFTQNNILGLLSFRELKNDKYIFVDHVNFQISILNLKTNYFNKFGRKGNGPGEFKFQPRDAQQFNDELIVLHGLGLTFFSTKNYSFIKAIPLYNTSMFALNKSDSLIYVASFLRINSKQKIFSIYDLEGNLIKDVYLEFAKKSKTKTGFDKVYLSFVDEKIFAVMEHSHNIYVYDKFGKYLKTVNVDYKYQTNPPAETVAHGSYIPFANQSIIKLTSNIYGLILGWNYKDHFKIVCFDKELKELGRLKLIKNPRNKLSPPIFVKAKKGFYFYHKSMEDLEVSFAKLDTNKLKQMLEIE